jgi:hypothetical protein
MPLAARRHARSAGNLRQRKRRSRRGPAGKCCMGCRGIRAACCRRPSHRRPHRTRLLRARPARRRVRPGNRRDPASNRTRLERTPRHRLRTRSSLRSRRPASMDTDPARRSHTMSKGRHIRGGCPCTALQRRPRRPRRHRTASSRRRERYPRGARRHRTASSRRRAVPDPQKASRGAWGEGGQPSCHKRRRYPRDAAGRRRSLGAQWVSVCRAMRRSCEVDGCPSWCTRLREVTRYRLGRAPCRHSAHAVACHESVAAPRPAVHEHGANPAVDSAIRAAVGSHDAPPAIRTSGCGAVETPLGSFSGCAGLVPVFAHGVFLSGNPDSPRRSSGPDWVPRARAGLIQSEEEPFFSVRAPCCFQIISNPRRRTSCVLPTQPRIFPNRSRVVSDRLSTTARSVHCSPSISTSSQT